ncbi:MAG: transcription-repair coupling factor [Geodermatophilaceae bacterium]|nr:transcription-repair coupling factor [Geodermatophilaceae bacterium]
MPLSGLLEAVLAEGDGRDLAEAARRHGVDVATITALNPIVVAAIATERERGGAGRLVLAVTATSRQADDLAAGLRCMLRDRQVEVFPAWETLPHERLSPRADTIGRRLAVLRRLVHPGPHDPLRVIVAPARSLLQPMAPGLADIEPVELVSGQSVELEVVVRRLVDAAYTRVDLVERRGEFAVRGGLLDVFPPTEEHPIRVEFWGDEVEELRPFSASDQRSLDLKVERLVAPACRELVLNDDVRRRAGELATQYPDLEEMLDAVADGRAIEGMEALTPLLIQAPMISLTALLPDGAHVLVCEPERVSARAIDLVRTSQEFLDASWSSAAVGAMMPLDLSGSALRSLEETRSEAVARGLLWSTVGALGGADEGGTAPTAPAASEAVGGGRPVVLRATPSVRYRGDLEQALSDTAELARDHWRVVLAFAGPGPAQRAAEQLSGAGLAVSIAPELPTELTPGVVYIAQAEIEEGFRSAELKLALLTQSDLTGQRGTSTKEMRRLPSRRRNTVDLLQLQPGDFVVHDQHGIGRYVEMIRRTINGGEREYLILEYAPSRRGQPGDRLFVPTDALELLTRYVGGESPALSRLGGSDWAKTKGRARKAVKQIAAELIRLYAARMSTPGYAFGPDTPWQHELEDAFPYVETPDQLAAIDEVKADMEKPIPMDRVICGDVGYGKTEIAVRAAFKAAQDGKQVAILVPTTLLAQQHFTTFSERMAQFPVTVAMVSRFNSPAQQADTLEKLANGTVDIVIGTHRLLQPSTKFHDLGLVIVDEEQRFGVEAKEYLKTLRAAVDVLTLSATPIPRTLEMSLTGIREMSTITTPPEERHPVLTYVGAHEPRQVAAAVRRELLRDGQIFYIHNRVQSIDKAAARLRELVPEARIAIAHGQQSEDQLEATMVGFWERDYDVLVSTTIVESGLDIANANTLIIERADLLGLSQLHQIRGRVGRGRERGYAYITYDPQRPLTEVAYDRLATIAQNTDLGSGIAVAMKDLEIRGAGNLLGGEQSGHIAGVGFDLYIRLVGEAVADFKGEAPTSEAADVRIDLPIDAHIPHDYIDGERLRMEAYRKLAAVTDDAIAEQVEAELTDRYGPVPPEVQALLAVARFRAALRAVGITEISLQGRSIRITPIQLADSAQLRLTRLAPDSVYKDASQVLSVRRPAGPAEPLRGIVLLDWLHRLITDLLGGGVRT